MKLLQGEGSEKKKKKRYQNIIESVMISSKFVPEEKNQ